VCDYGVEQAGIRCAAVADWTRACAHFKNSLEASILLYGKMDQRTISIAKLLHSARKRRTDGATDNKDEEDEGMDDAGSGDEQDGREELLYGEANVNATPRTIEVASNNDVNAVYRDAVAKVSPKGNKSKSKS
jgi:hypothetical protein